jgi:hypothetical protein
MCFVSSAYGTMTLSVFVWILGCNITQTAIKSVLLATNVAWFLVVTAVGTPLGI